MSIPILEAERSDLPAVIRLVMVRLAPASVMVREERILALVPEVNELVGKLGVALEERFTAAGARFVNADPWTILGDRDDPVASQFHWRV
jgi:hypothetical protein